jgi:hypothetical protein
MSLRTFTAAVIITAFAVAPSLAASVIPTDGQVLVNQGSGFKEISSPLELRAGDTVVLKPGSSASIKYSSNCIVPVVLGQVVTVAAKAPCVTQGAMEQTQATLPPPPAPPPVVGIIGAIGPGTIAAGAVVAGAVVAGTVAVTNSSKSSSP